MHGKHLCLYMYLIAPLSLLPSFAGGTFALYSIICRYAKIGTPNSRFQPSDSILQRYSTNNTLIRSRSHNERNKNNWVSCRSWFLLAKLALGAAHVIAVVNADSKHAGSKHAPHLWIHFLSVGKDNFLPYCSLEKISLLGKHLQASLP